VDGKKNFPIVVYCRSGSRSNMAMELLKREVRCCPLPGPRHRSAEAPNHLRRGQTRSARGLTRLAVAMQGFSEVYNLGGIVQASQAFDFYGSGSSLGPP